MEYENGFEWNLPDISSNILSGKPLFEDISGTTPEELEVELRRKEREIYLCSRLGNFLAEEMQELVEQRKGVSSDHTKALLELQELKFTNGITSNKKQELKMPSNKKNDIDVSLDNSDLISNCESVMTSTSHGTRDLKNDLNSVQKAHDRISRLELSLDATRARYRSLMTNYSHKLKEISQQLGSCIKKSRPYFDAVKKSKKCQVETQTATMEYKRTVSQHKVARDMVLVAEERVMQAVDKLDPTWQEMLNQANLKVSEASKEKSRVYNLHLEAAKAFQDAEKNRTELKIKLDKWVSRASPYFQIQREFQHQLEVTTKKLNLLELKLLESRHKYSMILEQLRHSDDVTTAGSSLIQRGSGVGAEHPLEEDLASQLPRPALDFLERYHESSPSSSVLEVDNKLRYNPYDLSYLSDLTDVGSNTGESCVSSQDDTQEYIQDF